MQRVVRPIKGLLGGAWRLRQHPTSFRPALPSDRGLDRQIGEVVMALLIRVEGATSAGVMAAARRARAQPSLTEVSQSQPASHLTSRSCFERSDRRSSGSSTGRKPVLFTIRWLPLA